MEVTHSEEIIVIRSLTDSDLGWFGAHRPYTASKQRAIQINAEVARVLLSKELFENGGQEFRCICSYQGVIDDSLRYFGKVGKNWRLGGNKLDGSVFSSVNSKDFLIIRGVTGNSGEHPLHLTFVTRQTNPIGQAKIARELESDLQRSMAAFSSGTDGFELLANFIPLPASVTDNNQEKIVKSGKRNGKRPTIPPMPKIRRPRPEDKRTIKDKVRSPHILEQMFRISGDMSAAAHHEFLEVLELMATQLRTVLLHTGQIIKFERAHKKVWKSVAGKPVAFVDGGMANLSMLGSAPVAARTGCYIVTPGKSGPDREQFITAKQLIDELYVGNNGGIYNGGFPEVSALRDVARITVEAAGAVQVAQERPDVRWMFVHGPLVNPVSRYTDIMDAGEVVHRFPDFSSSTIEKLLLPGEAGLEGRDANFINVYLRQLEFLRASGMVVCGVVERESAATSVYESILYKLTDHDVGDVLDRPVSEWRDWFIDNAEHFRINDVLLFRCALEAGEAITPIEIDRNELRRAPGAWQSVIARYPKPWVSYIMPSEWSQPFRIEIFDKDLGNFDQTAELLMHCALLLPRYAFPVGLDIVDKFAHIPNWMARPINTHTAVQTMRRALDSGNEEVFDALRKLLCGSSRDWLLRPKINGRGK